MSATSLLPSIFDDNRDGRATDVDIPDHYDESDFEVTNDSDQS